MYVISGMHRSGTSLVARLFYEAGADMGEADTFYPADRWNPDGYFEQADIHAVNFPLVNGSWGRLAYFCLPSPRTVLARAERRREQIAQTAITYSDKVVKETRFCLTLPAWLAHGARIRGVLICLRHPSAVARSLRRRNWITLRLAYRLWLVHLQRLTDHLAEIPVWLVRYENILDPVSFRAEFSPAAKFFQLQLDEERLDQLHQENVKRSWNHHAALEMECPPLVDQLWRQLLARHAAQFVPPTEGNPLSLPGNRQTPGTIASGGH